MNNRYRLVQDAFTERFRVGDDGIGERYIDGYECTTHGEVFGLSEKCPLCIREDEAAQAAAEAAAEEIPQVCSYCGCEADDDNDKVFGVSRICPDCWTDPMIWTGFVAPDEIGAREE